MPEQETVDALIACPTCKGKGTYPNGVTKYRAAGSLGGLVRIGCQTISRPCPKCYGTGYEPKRYEGKVECPLCGEVFSLEDMIAATLSLLRHECDNENDTA